MRSTLREQILSEIQRLAKANSGQPPGRRVFERETGIGEAAWSGVYWARWGDALREAGFEPNALQGKTDEGILLRNLAEAVRVHGKIPTSAELTCTGVETSFPSYKAIEARYGSKARIIERLAEWASKNDDFTDIALLEAGKLTQSSELVAPRNATVPSI